jgi:hypothetical protein
MGALWGSKVCREFTTGNREAKGTKWCDPLADRGLLNNWRGPDWPAQAKGNSMALRELSPSVSHLLQFQLRMLVGEILADPGLDPDMHASLLRHLSGHPGRPEVAMLAHLREVLDPRELPPMEFSYR